jgi:simple sugar transport system permease protein
MIKEEVNMNIRTTPSKNSNTLTFKQKVNSSVQTISILVVLVLLCIIFSISTDTFLSTGNFLNLLQQLAPNLVVAVLMTLVITTAGIDLSVGSILALASALTATFLGMGFGSLSTIFLVLLVGALIGSLNGYVTAYQNIPPFIVTLAGMIYIRGIALYVTEGYSIGIDGKPWLLWLGRGEIFNIPVAAILAILITIIGYVALNNTKYGSYVTGIGANEEAVRRSGVKIKKIKLITYTFTGVAASLAGLILAARLGSGSSNIGVAFELDIIAAVVLGGTSLFGGLGTIFGTLIGVSLIGIINNGLTLMHVSPYIIQIVQGIVLLLAVIINLRLFGKKK